MIAFAHPQYTEVEDSCVRGTSVMYEGTCTDAQHTHTHTHTHTEDIVLYRNPILYFLLRFVPVDPGEAEDTIPSLCVWI